MVEVQIPNKYLEVGNPFYNQAMKDWSIFLNDRGFPRKSIGEIVHITTDGITLVNFYDIVRLDDSDQIGFTCTIKVAEADINNEIPEGLPNREYEVCIADCETDDPIMETRIHTWYTWHGVNYPLPDLIEDPDNPGTWHYYILSYPFGTALTTEELLICDNSVDATLVQFGEVPYPPNMSGGNTTGIVIL